MEWSFRCERCGASEPLDTYEWRCPSCGGAFEIGSGPALDVDDIVHDDATLWRYASVLPVPGACRVSCGEGMTPLLKGTLAGYDVLLKNDSLLPTGSFKDRGASVLVAHLRRTGVRRVIVDSSGNAAAAMAGYCAAAGIDCTVYAPSSTSMGKLTQSKAFGATIVLVDGNRDAVASAAQEAAARDRSARYASHNWNAIFVEGVKTWAIEVWEQLGRRLPRAIFSPAGGGSAFVGAHRGFGAIGGTLPAHVACQPAACAPIARAVERIADTIEPVTPGDTIAEGTRIGSPARQIQILRAVRESGGWAQAVSETQIIRAMRDLWSQGIYVEPTAAVGAAAFIDAVESGRLAQTEDVVILLTGTGLKATDTISRVLGQA